MKSAGHVSGLALCKVRQRPGVPVGQGYTSTEMQGGKRTNIYTRKQSKKTTLQEEQRKRVWAQKTKLAEDIPVLCTGVL